MGDPKRSRKVFKKPSHPWIKSRLNDERKVKLKYGLANKRELWKTETFMKRKRAIARDLLAASQEIRDKRQPELMQGLDRLGIVQADSATLDDVLSLNVDSFLERRLQTILWRKNMANTIKQARQFIVHGHIAINGKKVSAPGMLVTKEEEKNISWFRKPMELEVKRPPQVEDKPADVAEQVGIIEEKAEDAAPAETKPEEKKE